MDFNLNDRYAMPFQTSVGADAGFSFGNAGLDGGKAVGGVGKTEGVDGEKKAGGRSSPEECETCKNRKYKDGSDESDVSFQTATHIDPSAAGARVRSHEQEHVTNAYSKAAEAGGKVISVGVAIHTSVCPECGRTYVSGGVTHSVIAYPNENGGSKIQSVNGDPKDAPKVGGEVSNQSAGGRGGREDFSIAVAAEPAKATGGTGAPAATAAVRKVQGGRAEGMFAGGDMTRANPYAAARKAAENRRSSGAIFRARV